MYGLKCDVHDATKLGDVSLNKLLDGSYKYPIYGEGKGKRTGNMSGNILDSVRKVFSFLPVRGPGRRQQPEDTSVALNKKASLLSSTSSSSVSSSTKPEAENQQVPDLSSGDIIRPNNVVSIVEVLTESIDFSLKTGEVLEHLVLPAPKELESLLRDATKLASTFKVFRATFFQGRWVRIANNSSFFGGGIDGFADLGSLTYDPSLVPPRQVKYTIPKWEALRRFPTRMKSSGLLLEYVDRFLFSLW
ncbi:hypothetical protein Dimus_030869 [Dionaea muscipula]